MKNNFIQVIPKNNFHNEGIYVNYIPSYTKSNKKCKIIVDFYKLSYSKLNLKLKYIQHVTIIQYPGQGIFDNYNCYLFLNT